MINHGLAGALGAWITDAVSPQVLRWVLGASFIAMAAWTLIPDKIEEEETRIASRLGVFGATFITFFLAEMGVPSVVGEAVHQSLAIASALGHGAKFVPSLVEAQEQLAHVALVWN